MLYAKNQLSHSRREKVSLNPVTSRICETSGAGKDASRIGYIKLASFNENASGTVLQLIISYHWNKIALIVNVYTFMCSRLVNKSCFPVHSWLDCDSIDSNIHLLQ